MQKNNITKKHAYNAPTVCLVMLLLPRVLRKTFLLRML